ncbi:N-acetyl-gamma-glutamyl-phosphate reductase [Muribacter muris]|uniref:N-acetyl-gamma-glutamyl-phosphate reductase n=1 Tax=Muribacter muris TaxID=67855 RepID=A0A4Y9JV42_9PAST|nr:N-acetyl-gamma-glutamyl-phosphate reductase [Muribacter muris]MBF0785358.1 N-acetyl-gamma-glutamyl-phosphate reductase [Muribacter muris]MBF0826013.1 N-acetyl-gamma-glutamyl-phosphate reductase [Muribacter muris]TFV09621.1 N-acetyl-gamma-glutamyl-phosphate reductase [Muribacter muris]
MAQYRIFVDGAVGTTGLRIHERLSNQADIRLLTLAENERKCLTARLAKIREADLTFLCLPDEAAREIIALAPDTARICDTSTAHRTHADWVYGLAELSGQREKIASAKRVAVPGCHATGFISLIRPLIERQALAADYPLSCQSLTGYSGGGKPMIADYQATDRPAALNAPRLYGLGLLHKHLPEMQRFTGSQAAPIFTPVVADYHSGMLVSVPLPLAAINAPFRSGETVQQLLADYYCHTKLIRVQPHAQMDTDGMLAANALAGKDHLEINVFSNEHQLLLTARFDNLGKGASGAAIQCMNLMLGRNETAGLEWH